MKRSLIFCGPDSPKFVSKLSQYIVDDISLSSCINYHDLQSQCLGNYSLIIPITQQDADIFHHFPSYIPFKLLLYHPHPSIPQTFKTWNDLTKNIDDLSKNISDVDKINDQNNVIFIIRPFDLSHRKGMYLKQKKYINKDDFSNYRIAQQYVPTLHEFELLIFVSDGVIFWHRCFQFIFRKDLHLRNDSINYTKINEQTVDDTVLRFIETFFVPKFFFNGLCTIDFVRDSSGQIKITDFRYCISELLIDDRFVHILLDLLNYMFCFKYYHDLITLNVFTYISDADCQTNCDPSSNHHITSTISPNNEPPNIIVPTDNAQNNINESSPNIPTSH